MSYIEFENVSKVYGNERQQIKALDGIDLKIDEGELCVIVGPSGAGKTTLLNILGGMDTVSSGTVKLGKKYISDMDENQLTRYRRTDVGFVFQFYNLVQNLTALENVELTAELCPKHLDPMGVLRQVGLRDRADNFPSQLSGGEQQRVSIARALVKNPKLILCDEPTGALDYNTGKAVLKLLQDTCIITGKTVIIITHNSAISQIADKVIRIKNGKAISVEKNAVPMSAERVEW